MEVINFIEKLNWQTIFAMFAIGWYFTRDIRISLDKLDSDVRAQGARTDKLYEMFVDLLKERK
jgi:hypothetical protein